MGLFLVGGCSPYIRNIRELVRLLPPDERDIAEAIDRNAVEAQRRIRRVQVILSELSDVIGYRYLRKEKR